MPVLQTRKHYRTQATAALWAKFSIKTLAYMTRKCRALRGPLWAG